MERLTEKELYDGKVYYTKCSKTNCKDRCCDCPVEQEIPIKLKRYEDAEENGLLKHLPCRVGDTVYCLTSARTKFVECKVLWIEIHENGVMVFSLDGGPGDVVLAHLGKTWFSTREEAEKALAKMKGV